MCYYTFYMLYNSYDSSYFLEISCSHPFCLTTFNLFYLPDETSVFTVTQLRPVWLVTGAGQGWQQQLCRLEELNPSQFVPPPQICQDPPRAARQALLVSAEREGGNWVQIVIRIKIPRYIHHSQVDSEHWEARGQEDQAEEVRTDQWAREATQHILNSK